MIVRFLSILCYIILFTEMACITWLWSCFILHRNNIRGLLRSYFITYWTDMQHLIRMLYYLTEIMCIACLGHCFNTHQYDIHYLTKKLLYFSMEWVAPFVREVVTKMVYIVWLEGCFINTHWNNVHNLIRMLFLSHQNDIHNLLKRFLLFNDMTSTT